ncbi:MAG: response regulator [Oscillospiraceae bacterium]|nr:response regulator [Oscillospiraceae bacterium]
MKILALDDSEPALKLLACTIKEVQPGADVFSFGKPSELLDFAKNNTCDTAFLDIQLWGISGLAVAKKLKEYNQKINIIFVTAFSEYASEAFDLYPSGYVLKPVTHEAVKKELENLRHPVDRKSNALLYAQTFGNFEVFSYGTPIKFSYSKTKELFAYLVDRNGASVNMNELCAILWENEEDSSNLKAYLRKLISDLIKSFSAIGAEDAIIKRHNSIAVIPEKITCDSYGFLKGDPMFVNTYSGQYMTQYSWAERTTGFIDNLTYDKQ